MCVCAGYGMGMQPGMMGQMNMGAVGMQGPNAKQSSFQQRTDQAFSAFGSMKQWSTASVDLCYWYSRAKGFSDWSFWGVRHSYSLLTARSGADEGWACVVPCSLHSRSPGVHLFIVLNGHSTCGRWYLETFWLWANQRWVEMRFRPLCSLSVRKLQKYNYISHKDFFLGAFFVFVFAFLQSRHKCLGSPCPIVCVWSSTVKPSEILHTVKWCL